MQRVHQNSNNQLSPQSFKRQHNQITPQLIVFDQICDDLEDISDQSQRQSKHSKRQSILSDQTQKRKKQVRDKFQGYLKGQGRLSIDKNNHKKDQQYFQDQDGRLVNQLDSIQFVQKFNREIQYFILLFNKNPENAINDYIKKGIIIDDSPQAIAEYLIKIQGLNKVTLGDYFGQNNPKVLKVLRQYCNLLNFKDQQFDKSMRRLLSKFRLPGQAQQIERVIYQFTLAYYEVNQNTHSNADQLFPLAYSIIMLATDAHNPKQQKKMTKQQFIKNTRGACPSIQPDYLSHIYDRITKQKFETQISYIQTLYARLRDLSLPNIGEALKFTKQLMKGDIFLKICRNTNKFVQRKIYLSQDQQRIYWISDPPKTIQQPRYILISDIIDLTLGLGSAVMQKNKVPEQFDSMCFTIHTTHRTLDLKAKSNKDRAKWVNYIRALLIQRRQQRRQTMENLYDAIWNPQKIEQIWNTDIFPMWDKHWDYKNKKPKEKGYIAKGLDAICCCYRAKQGPERFEENGIHSSGFKIKSTLLESLWKQGLPPTSRKTLWMLVIGNNLALTNHIIEDMKKKRKQIPELEKYPFEKQVIEIAQTLLVRRPDIPPVRDILLISQVFWKVIPKGPNTHPLYGLVNLIHLHHFLAFYSGDKTQIQLRIQLFEHLLSINASKVGYHFKGLKIETRMYLVSWFLSVFANCFTNQFLYRIWDNFLLEGQIYLFKVGIAIIKYYQIELKMCTFNQGLKLLRFPKNTSIVLFFQILENQIDVKIQHYDNYIQKRNHAIIKTKVQSIPLE